MTSESSRGYTEGATFVYFTLVLPVYLTLLLDLRARRAQLGTLAYFPPH